MGCPSVFSVPCPGGGRQQARERGAGRESPRGKWPWARWVVLSALAGGAATYAWLLGWIHWSTRVDRGFHKQHQERAAAVQAAVHAAVRGAVRAAAGPPRPEKAATPPRREGGRGGRVEALTDVSKRTTGDYRGSGSGGTARRRNPWVRPFVIRESSPADPHVDVVVTWHCDDIDWVEKIDRALAPIITLVLLHKLDDSDLKEPRCRRPAPEIPPINVTYVRLPNQGRDIHSPFAFFSHNYHALATYTMFLQADHHWFVGQWAKGFHGFASNDAIVNELVPLALRKRPSFLPVAPFLGGLDGEPILFLDRESNEDTSAQDAGDPAFLRKFRAGVSDVYGHVRDMHRVIFGSDPCSLGEVIFVPGFQFVVRRDMALARPRGVWEALEDLALGCHAGTYSLERLSIVLFNTSEAVAPPASWGPVVGCPGTGGAAEAPASPNYKEPFNPYEASEFWRHVWHCDPLSPFLRSRENTSRLAALAAAKLAGRPPPSGGRRFEEDWNSSACSWSVVYDQWIGPGTGATYAKGRCLRSCCDEADCVALAWHSDGSSQCYKVAQRPQGLRHGAVVPLPDFDFALPAVWSVLLKQ